MKKEESKKKAFQYFSGPQNDPTSSPGLFPQKKALGTRLKMIK